MPPSAATILITDDDAAIRQALRRLLSDSFDVREAETAEDALAQLEEDLAHVVLLDINMPGMGGEAGLVELRKRFPGVEVIIITGQAEVDLAVKCMRNGAFDFLAKPFQPVDRVLLSVERALERQALRLRSRTLEKELRDLQGFAAIVGKSKAIGTLIEDAAAVAARDTTVLISGESGTGKELVARGIYLQSPRRAKPFVPVNCGALPGDIVESELFGHVKGAFTGALRDAVGLFREADGGTLFLDEVGELPAAAQVKLLRVLEEREVRPVGATKATPVDVRLIAATNRDLERQVEDGTFRSDLYYRLAVVPLTVPPLRERREDIPLLIDHFWQRFSHGSRPDVSPEAMQALTSFDWPGNVRQLENTLERIHILRPGDRIELPDLPTALRGESPPAGVDESEIPLTFEAYERLALLRALRECSGDADASARRLGISRATLYRKLRTAGLRLADFQR